MKPRCEIQPANYPWFTRATPCYSCLELIQNFWDQCYELSHIVNIISKYLDEAA